MSARTITCYVVAWPRTKANPGDRYRVVAHEDLLAVCFGEMKPEDLPAVAEREILTMAERVCAKFNFDLVAHKELVDPLGHGFEELDDE